MGPQNCIFSSIIFGVGFRQNGFVAIFIILPPDFFADLVADFFPHFFGEKVPRKIPGKILQILYNKIPRHISAEGPGQYFLPFAFWFSFLLCFQLLGFLVPGQ